MLRRFLTGVLVVALLLTTVTTPVSSGSEELGFTAVAAVAPDDDDGGWWVLERSLQDRGGVVYHYSDSWTRTGERHRIRLGAEDGGSPTDIAAAPGGGWWVLGGGGEVHRFSENWTYAGRSRALAHPTYDRNLTEAFDLTRTADGGWWVAGGRDLVRYGNDWTVADGGVDGVASLSSGYPVAVGYGPDNSFWVLEGYTGTGVARYPLTEDGNGIAPAPNGTVEGDEGRTLARPITGYGLHDVVDLPVDVARAGNGWWVVDADGQVHRFDRYWRYTGVSHSVGSGDAEGTYPGHFVSPLILLVPLVSGLVWLLPATIIGAGVLWNARVDGRPSILAGAMGAAAFVYGVAWRPFLLRPVVFAEPHLPLVVVLVTLALAGAHLYSFVSTDERIVPVALTYLPAAVAAAWMLVLAARAWL